VTDFSSPQHTDGLWIQRALCLNLRRPGYNIDHSSLSSAMVDNDASVSPLPHASLCHGSFLLNDSSEVQNVRVF
jgi:hypothetical protein